MPVGQGHHAPAAEDKGFKVHFKHYKQDGRGILGANQALTFGKKHDSIGCYFIIV
jgi:hypothetical protein